MNRRILIVFMSLVFAASAAMAQAPAGLTRVKSRQLDELLVAKSANLASYRKILVEPAKAEVHPGWRRSINDSLAGPKVTQADADRIASEASKGLTTIVAEAFKAKGYEVVSAPGPGVMRLSASAAEIFVNAPDTKEAGVRSLAEDAGTARMKVVASDSVSGVPLASSTHRLTAAGSATGGPTMQTSVSNRFWFTNAFSRWATNVAAELQAAGGKAPAS